MTSKVYNVVPANNNGTYLTTHNLKEAQKCCAELNKAGKNVHIQCIIYDDPWA